MSVYILTTDVLSSSENTGILASRTTIKSSRFSNSYQVGGQKGSDFPLTVCCCYYSKIWYWLTKHLIFFLEFRTDVICILIVFDSKCSKILTAIIRVSLCLILHLILCFFDIVVQDLNQDYYSIQ